MGLAQPKPIYTDEEYRALERDADYRSEYYDGEIYDVSVDEVERVLTAASAAQPISTMVINSPGGSEAAIRLGEIVFARKLAVTVRKVCASACANWVALPAWWQAGARNQRGACSQHQQFGPHSGPRLSNPLADNSELLLPSR